MKAPLLMVLALLVGGCAAPARTAREEGLDAGYVLGQADAVKQLYWAKQALEAARSPAPAGRLEYYTWQDGGTAADGRRLAPETVAVPVFVPAPAPAGGPP